MVSGLATELMKATALVESSNGWNHVAVLGRRIPWRRRRTPSWELRRERRKFAVRRFARGIRGLDKSCTLAH
jgi:hypothetical protein